MEKEQAESVHIVHGKVCRLLLFITSRALSCQMSLSVTYLPDHRVRELFSPRREMY